MIPERCECCKYIDTNNRECLASDLPIEEGCYYYNEEGEV